MKMNLLPHLISGLFVAGVSASAATQPNIVYILADDMGQGDVSAYNPNGKIPTPNIDRMVREGMKFTDAHTSSSVCSPTRYGIMTGRHTWRSQLKKGVLSGHSPHLIETGRETVASFMKKQGYKTACIGKWHLGMDWALKPEFKPGKSMRISNKYVDITQPIKNGPRSVGFDYYYGISASLNMDPHAFIEGEKMLGTPEYLKDQAALDRRGFIGAKTGWSSKEFVQDQVLPTFTSKTCEWIRQNADQPFFVYMPLNAPHSPIVPNADFKGKSGLNEHGDFCMETDWAVGEVLKTIDDLNLASNTIVIFTADNGTSPKAHVKEMQEKGHYTSLIYRGLKGTTWEGGHRVPFVVRWPQGVKAGTVSEQVICTTDLIATCADVLGQTLADNAGEDSVSFLPALQGKKIPGVENRMITHHSDGGIFALRRGKWKLMLENKGGSHRKNPKDKPVINNAKMLLFDMENDPRESTNLSAQYPEVVTQLKKELAAIIKAGRSTPGANQPSDYNDPSVDWPQLKPILEYLK